MNVNDNSLHPTPLGRSPTRDNLDNNVEKSSSTNTARPNEPGTIGDPSIVLTHSLATAPLSNHLGTPSDNPVSTLLKNRLIEAGFFSDDRFKPFQQLPGALLDFLAADTLCMPLCPQTHDLTPETRFITDAQGHIRGGDHSQWESPNDGYTPGRMQPFEIKGYWIPVDKLMVASGIDAQSGSRHQTGTCTK